MPAARRPLLLALVASLLLAGCNTVVYQTRYLPRSSELTWEKSYKQLPWRPPAVGEQEHYPRNGKPAKPTWAPETQYSIAQPPGEYRYANDGKGGPITPEMEAERKQWLIDTRGIELRDD